MRILVTGGAGLIGSHLCQLLLDEGNYVVCIDNLKTGSLDNIHKYVNNPNFIMVNADIIDGIPNLKIDQIYNLASPTAPGHFRIDPISTITTNVVGTINILELAKKQNIPVVHVSSIRTLENNNTFDSNACYIESKRCSETICYEYKKMGVDVKVARLFNVYGEGMKYNDSRVIPQFTLKAINDIDLDIFGDGSQIDSFCYVQDIIIGLKKLMGIKVDTAINMGSREFVPIISLAKMIIDITKSKAKINFIKGGELFQNRTKFYIDNIEGWEPMITLQNGLNKYCLNSIKHFSEIKY